MSEHIIDLWNNIWLSFRISDGLIDLGKNEDYLYWQNSLLSSDFLERITKPSSEEDYLAFEQITDEIAKLYGYTVYDFSHRNYDLAPLEHTGMSMEIREDFHMTFAGFCNHRTKNEAFKKMKQVVSSLDSEKFKGFFDLSPELRATLVGAEEFTVETALMEIDARF